MFSVVNVMTGIIQTVSKYLSEVLGSILAGYVLLASTHTPL